MGDPAAPAVDRSIDFCGVALRGPVFNGSGTFDVIAAHRAFGDALIERFPFDAFVSKTITLAPRQGNPPPRLWETPAGLINSIGLPNKGLDGFLDSDLPEIAAILDRAGHGLERSDSSSRGQALEGSGPSSARGIPLVVSVMGFSRDELVVLVAATGQRDEVAMLELNVSCPNVETGLVMGADPGETALAVERVRSETAKPLIVKLTPNAAEPAAVAVAAQEAGADAISLVNTLKGMALDPQTGEHWLGGKTGGVSGPAIRAIALEQVAAVAQRVQIPVIGMGGIASGRHARDFLTAGASAVAVGTESFRDPAAGRRIAGELAEPSLIGASRAPASTPGRARLGDTGLDFRRRLREVSGRRP
jgi:dihydroorotate dehydrogenase (NAD+) catalytic subunit